MAQNRSCSSCKNARGLIIGNCDECSFKFCQYCYADHAIVMKKVYPILSEEEFELKCPSHGLRITYFCNERSCMQAICEYCAKERHNVHKFCTISERAQQNLYELSTLDKRNRDKIDEVEGFISTLDEGKVSFEEDARKVQTQIQVKFNNFIVCANKTFHDNIENFKLQCKAISNEILEEWRTLQKYKEELKNACQLISHFPSSAPDFKILRYWKNFERACNLKTSIAHFFEIKSVAFKESIFPRMPDFADYAGAVLTVVKEDIFYDTSHKASITDLVHETNSVVKDVLYDIHYDHLFVLLKRTHQLYIKIFYENILLAEVPLEIRQDPKHIALLSNRTVLLHYDNRLKLVPLGSTPQHVNLPTKIRNLFDVLTICSSPCQNYVYGFCKSGNIFKYNYIANHSKEKRLYVNFLPTWMSVNGSLEYIAFTGYDVKWINVYSYYQGNIAYTLGKHGSAYSHTLFLQDDVLVAIDVIKCSLDVLTLSQEKAIRRISSISHKDKERKFGVVCGMTQFSPISIIIGELDRFYKISPIMDFD